jgi:acetyltransferase-like isoleucine patch superfamily enzyme
MPRAIRILYPVLSLVSPLLVGLVIGLAALPGYLLVCWTWLLLGSAIGTFSGALIFCLALGLAFVVCGNALLLVIVVLRFVLQLHNVETRGKVFSVESIRHALYSLLLHVASVTYLQFLKSNYFNLWFYRAMGAKIGKGTLIATNRIWDCDLVEIGENCLVGGNASISAHYAVGALGRLRKVRIGNNVTIGANTSVMAGVTIGDNVVVGANSLVPVGMHLESGGRYLGVPVQRVK